MGHIALSVWFRADRVYLESNKLTLATPIYGIITDIWFLTSAECRSCIKEFCSSVSKASGQTWSGCALVRCP